MPTSVWVWSPKPRRPRRKSGDKPQENSVEEKDKNKDVFDHLFDGAKKGDKVHSHLRRAVSAHSNTRRKNAAKRDLSAPIVPTDSQSARQTDATAEIQDDFSPLKQCQGDYTDTKQCQSDYLRECYTKLKGERQKQGTNSCNLQGCPTEQKTDQIRNSNTFYEHLTKSVRDFCISKNIERDDTFDGIPGAGDRVSRWVDTVNSGNNHLNHEQIPSSDQKLTSDYERLPPERSSGDVKESRKSFPVLNFSRKNMNVPISSREHNTSSKTNGKSLNKSQASMSTPRNILKSANTKNGINGNNPNRPASPIFVSRKKVSPPASPANRTAQSSPSSPISTREQNPLLDSTFTTPEEYQKYLLSIACPHNRALPGRTEISSPSDRISLGLDCDEVFPGVIISTGATVRNLGYLRSLGVTHIINTACRDVWLPQDKLSNLAIQYYLFHVDDVSSANITPFFQPSAEFMGDGLAQGGIVVVNCLVGLSRSATIVAASIMVNLHWSLRRVLHHLRQRRPVRPNSGFLRQLIQLEADLRRKGICLC